MNRRLLALLLLLGVLGASCGTRRDAADFATLATGAGAVAQEGAGGSAAALDPGAAPGDPAAPDGGPAAPDAGPGTAAGDPAAPGAAEAGAPAAATDGQAAAGGPAAPGPAGAAGPARPAGAATGGGSSGRGPNTASDVGVTPTQITLGNVISVKGLAGPEQFPPMYFGAAAYFNDLNARGGINGRKVVFQTCDDEYTTSGNVRCIRDFIDKSKVFAFVSTACGVCDGLTYAEDKGVPTVGGLATDFQSYAVDNFWPTQGNPYPPNGKIGWKGKVYYGTAQYRFFKEKYGIKKAGIVYYDNAAPSKNAALGYAKQMEAEGIEPFLYGLNVALPQYDSAVLDMKSRGVTGMWDAIDIVGNQNLCKSIDSNGLKLTAKVSSSAAWSDAVGGNFSSPCRRSIFSVEAPGSMPYSLTSNPEVAKFRAAMKRYFPQREAKMSQWTLDGWANAMWFAEAAESCGADLTRDCLQQYLDKPYGAKGLWVPRTNTKIDFDRQKTTKDCPSIVQWDDGKKTFVPRGTPGGTCYTTPLVGQTIS